MTLGVLTGNTTLDIVLITLGVLFLMKNIGFGELLLVLIVAYMIWG